MSAMAEMVVRACEALDADGWDCYFPEPGTGCPEILAGYMIQNPSWWEDIPLLERVADGPSWRWTLPEGVSWATVQEHLQRLCAAVAAEV